MGYCQMIELLQKKEKGKIVFCNSGNFYVAIGKDAVLLNNLIGLKVSCIKPEICKVGFPISSLEKYEGKNRNNLLNENINCYICSKGTKKYKKEDKYISALAKLYEEEIEKEENYKNIKDNEESERKRKRKIWFQNKNKKINYN